MPRSFLVKKAKYANDARRSFHSGSYQTYRSAPLSPTEGETAPTSVSGLVTVTAGNGLNNGHNHSQQNGNVTTTTGTAVASSLNAPKLVGKSFGKFGFYFFFLLFINHSPHTYCLPGYSFYINSKCSPSPSCVFIRSFQNTPDYKPFFSFFSNVIFYLLFVASFSIT